MPLRYSYRDFDVEHVLFYIVQIAVLILIIYNIPINYCCAFTSYIDMLHNMFQMYTNDVMKFNRKILFYTTRRYSVRIR